MIRKERIELLREIVEELKVVGVEEIQKKGFIKTKAYNFRINNGRVITREQIIKGGNDGSACIIVPIDKNKEILTVIEPRVFTKEQVGVGFPAGYIENLETTYEGALRELKEETGYVPNKMIEIDSFYQDEGCSKALNRIFVALDCEKRYEQKLDKDEIVKYMKFNYDELLELERLGYIKSANSKLALMKAKAYMKGR